METPEMNQVESSNATTDKIEKEFTYLKLIQQKRHYGPTGASQTGYIDNMSKASGKIKATSDLKIKLSKSTGNQTEGQELSSKKKTTSRSWSILTDKFVKEDDAESKSLYYNLAWDDYTKGLSGTPKFREAKAEFDKNRAQWYADHGIPVSPDQKKNKPVLTEQQRKEYSEDMKQFSFDYFEYNLSFRKKGGKAIRSLTYKAKSQLDTDNLIKQLRDRVSVLSEKYTISKKELKSV